MENKKVPNIKDRINFQYLRNNGHRTQLNPWFIVYWEFSNSGKNRFLWSLSRKVSNAVIRNKLKRWCREFFRTSPVLKNQGLNLNFVFRPQRNDFYKDLRREVLEYELKKLENKIKSYLEYNKNHT